MPSIRKNDTYALRSGVGIMKKLGKVFILLFMVWSLSACSYVFGRTITLKVVDQQGCPVPEASVGMGFLRSHGGAERSGLTDDKGLVSMRGNDLYGARTFIEKTGFYLTERRIGGDESVNIKIMLRRRKKPVSMYAKEKTIKIPSLGDKVGFNLETAKTVRADSDSAKADMYFSLSGYNRSKNDLKATMRLSFKNEESGIKKVDPVSRYSEFQFPYSAPAKGYVSQIQRSYQYGSGESDDDFSYKSNIEEGALGYIFRIVRDSDKGEDNQSVTYGRMMGEFEFHIAPGGEPGGEIYLTYYYNPDPESRSLEFNPRRNLFRNADQTYPP
jgi:hypothetical protein